MKYNLVESKKEYLHLEITGKYSLEQGEKLFEKIHDECVERKIKKLLLDITKKEGVIPTMDRFIFGKLIANLFSTDIKFALIAKKDQINKFSETVAVNRGARFNIFSDKTEAIEWLLK